MLLARNDKRVIYVYILNVEYVIENIEFEESSLPSGIFFYKLETDDFIQTKDGIGEVGVYKVSKFIKFVKWFPKLGLGKQINEKILIG